MIKKVLLLGLVTFAILQVCLTTVVFFRKAHGSPLSFSFLGVNIGDAGNNMKNCLDLQAKLAQQEQEVVLFGEKLVLKSIDCEEEITDPSDSNYEDDTIMYSAQLYHGKNFVAKKSQYNSLLDISIAQATDFLGYGESVFLPVLDITNQLSINSKSLSGNYKIIVSVGPTQDAPRSDGKFTVSLLGQTGEFAYTSREFEIPELSDLIQQVEFNVQKDKREFTGAIGELLQRYLGDQTRNSDAYGDSISYKSVQYIANIIGQNQKYKDFVIEEAKIFIQSIGLQ